jgi:NAD(P)-dependent dehydrogenase (short-subunit alcohol dehydrogenase family)
MNRFKDLKDCVCLVTGAAGVLCSVMVEALCEAGARVALLGRTEEKLEALAAELYEKGFSQTIPIRADVLIQEDLERARRTIREKFGPVQLLINGAGGNHPGAVTQSEILEGSGPEEMARGFFGTDIEAFRSVFDLNFMGTLLPCKVFGEDMVAAGSGTIINISSMSATIPLTKVAAYSAAKASVDNFTRWLSVHFSRSNIRVNALAPGFFSTVQNRFLLYEQDGKTLTERGNKIITHTPMGEFGSPEDLKGALLFLASSQQSRFVTGIVLPVDGGFSAYPGV